MNKIVNAHPHNSGSYLKIFGQREILKELLCQSFTEQSSPVAHVHLNNLIFRSSLLHVPMNLNRSLLCNLGKLISLRPF